MKKLTLFLTALLLVGCSNQTITNQFQNNSPIQKTFVNSSSLTAKTAYPIALKEAKKLLSTPQLFEIDIWKESETEVIHFGFMQKNTGGSYKFIRVIVDPQTSKVSHETIPDNGKVPSPVDLKYWKLDHKVILNIAQTNGLRDHTYLATLWENTWHISGLKQHLYFQIDSQNGGIKMICTDPYLTQCTSADHEPITPRLSSEFQKKLNLLR